MPEREQSTGSVFPRFLGFWTEERSLTFMLLLLAIHFFIVTPATFLRHAFNIIGSLLFSLALLVGLLAIVRKRILRWLGDSPCCRSYSLQDCDAFFRRSRVDHR